VNASLDESGSSEPLNWPAIVALYAALLLGLGWMLYWGDYRNAAWLLLIGTGGALTAYGRVLERRGDADVGRLWTWAGAFVYAVFFVWAGTVLFQIWTGR